MKQDQPVILSIKLKPNSNPELPPPGMENEFGAPCVSCEKWHPEAMLNKTAEVACPHGGPEISQSIPKEGFTFSREFIDSVHPGDEVFLILLCDGCKLRG